MPVYEYTCTACKTHFEKLVRSMSATAEKIACPNCASEKTARALSVFAVASDTKSSAPPVDRNVRMRSGPGVVRRIVIGCTFIRSSILPH